MNHSIYIFYNPHKTNSVCKLSMDSKGNYYQNFSTYVIQSPSAKPSTKYSYSIWKNTPTTLCQLTIPELKSALKFESCRVSGKRHELLKRLSSHYRKIQSVILLQKHFRAFLVRDSEKLRGEGYKFRSTCVNETDFQTMDSVANIPRESFFSYTDSCGFVYGFNIFSLMAMFKRNRKFFNPYNREDIPIETVCRIFSLYKKIEILYPLAFKESKIENAAEIKLVIDQTIRLREDLGGVVIPATFDIEQDIQRRTRAVFERMQSRTLSRIDPECFLTLSKNEYDRFYHFYHVWWTRSNSLSDFEKREICSFPDPFVSISQIRPTWTEPDYRLICLELLERMSETLAGSEQSLMLFTVVSISARRVRPDLFERFH